MSKKLDSVDFSSVVNSKINKAKGLPVVPKIKKPTTPTIGKPNINLDGYEQNVAVTDNSKKLTVSDGGEVEETVETGETGETSGFNFEEAVKSPYGMSELNNYLYDSKLQNVFKDYQENIASLNKSEQQNLEDAYYIREMSKKYLGEYASNVGIGDVSGNLLDIYGNYQSSKADIKANYDALEMNLTQEYRNEKTAMFNEKMQEQYNMELADFEESSQEIMFNAVTGGYDTELYADEWEYLDAMKASGDMSTSDYQMAYGSMYSTMLDRIQTNLENQNYEGFATSEEYINSFGKLTDGDKSMLQGISKQIDKQNTITDITNNLMTGNYGEGVEGLDYLESVRSTIGEEAYQQYYGKIYADVAQEAFGLEDFDPETMTVDEYVSQYEGKLSTSDIDELREGLGDIVEQYEMARIDTSIGNQDSENYIGADYNFYVNTGGENVGAGSYMYQDANGNKMFGVLDDSEADEAVSGWYASHEDLTEAFKDENDGANPKTGKEVEYSAYNQETGETQTFSYVFQNGRWHRMVQEDFISNPDMMQWKNTEGTGKGRDNGRKITEGDDFKIDNREDGKSLFDWKKWDEKDTFVYKGKTFIQGEEFTENLNGVDAVAGADQKINSSYNEVNKLFTEVHGDASTGDSIVYYNNKFYIRKTNGKIYIMNEE